jgi:hypothetical protein
MGRTMKVVQAYAETLEHLPVDVTVGGAITTSGIEFAVLPEGGRPVEGDWTDSVLLEGRSGVMIADLTPGYYWVWVRVSASPETPAFVGVHIRIK